MFNGSDINIINNIESFDTFPIRRHHHHLLIYMHIFHDIRLCLH